MSDASAGKGGGGSAASLDDLLGSEMAVLTPSGASTGTLGASTTGLTLASGTPAVTVTSARTSGSGSGSGSGSESGSRNSGSGSTSSSSTAASHLSFFSLQQSSSASVVPEVLPFIPGLRLTAQHTSDGLSAHGEGHRMGRRVTMDPGVGVGPGAVGNGSSVGGDVSASQTLATMSRQGSVGRLGTTSQQAGGGGGDSSVGGRLVHDPHAAPWGGDDSSGSDDEGGSDYVPRNEAPMPFDLDVGSILEESISSDATSRVTTIRTESERLDFLISALETRRRKIRRKCARLELKLQTSLGPELNKVFKVSDVASYCARLQPVVANLESLALPDVIHAVVEATNKYAGVDRSPLDSSPEVQEIHRRLSSFLTRCLRKYGERVSSVPLGMSAQSFTNVGRSKQETKTGAGGGAASHVVYEIMLAVHAIEPLDSAWQIFVEFFRNLVGLRDLQQYHTSPIPREALLDLAASLETHVPRLCTMPVLDLFRNQADVKDARAHALLLRILFADDFLLLADIKLYSCSSFGAMADVFLTVSDTFAFLCSVMVVSLGASVTNALDELVNESLGRHVTRCVGIPEALENYAMDLVRVEARHFNQYHLLAVSQPLPFGSTLDMAVSHAKLSVTVSVLRLVRRLDTLARLFVLPCFVNDMLEPFFDGMRRALEVVCGHQIKVVRQVPTACPVSFLYASISGAELLLTRIQSYREAFVRQGAVNVDTLACDSLGLVRSLLDLVTARLRAVHGETVHTMMTADVAKQAWSSLRGFHHWSPMPTHGLQLWRSVCDRLSSEYTSFLFPATAQELFGAFLQASVIALGAVYLALTPSSARVAQYSMDVAFLVGHARLFTWPLVPPSHSTTMHTHAMQLVISEVESMCHMLLLARAFIAGPLDALVSYARGGAAVGKGDTRTDHVGSDLCPLPPNAGYLYKARKLTVIASLINIVVTPTIDWRLLRNHVCDLGTGLALAMGEVATPKRKQEVSNALAALFAAEGMLQEFVSTCFRNEVESVTGESTLFRGEGLAVKLIAGIARRRGSDYARAMVGSFVQDIMSNPNDYILGGPKGGKSKGRRRRESRLDDVDSGSDSDDSDASGDGAPSLNQSKASVASRGSRGSRRSDGAGKKLRNSDGGEPLGLPPRADTNKQHRGPPLQFAPERFYANTSEVAIKILDNVVSHPEDIPPILLFVCQELVSQARRRYPTINKGTAVGGVLFLRLLCPAIVQPDLYGISNVKPKRRQQMALVNVSKILQNVANGRHFSDPVFEGLNTFVDHQVEEVHSFFRAVLRAPLYALPRENPAHLRTSMGRTHPAARVLQTELLRNIEAITMELSESVVIVSPISRQQHMEELASLLRVLSTNQLSAKLDNIDLTNYHLSSADIYALTKRISATETYEEDSVRALQATWVERRAPEVDKVASVESLVSMLEPREAGGGKEAAQSSRKKRDRGSSRRSKKKRQR